MENCLVTKLKGILDNSNLSKYGEIEFRIIEEEDFSGKWLAINSADGKPITITAFDGGTFTVNNDQTVRTTFSTPENDTSAYTIKFSNGTYKCSIGNKYSLGRWNQFVEVGHSNSNIELNIEDLKYCPLSVLTAYENKSIYGNIDVLDKSYFRLFVVTNCDNVEGTWAGFTNPNLSTLSVSGTQIGGLLADLPALITDMNINYNLNVYGSLDDIADRTNLTRVSIVGCNNISGGRLESLGGNVNLTRIIMSELRNYSGFNGSVEAFVAAQIAAGRTTCPTSSPITCPWLLYAATFGGQKYNVANYMYLTWDSANKITIYNGNQGIDNCENIYAKGATAQEIADWEQAGKNVVVIS